MCSTRKVRCSFLDDRRKRKNDEVDSEGDEEPTPKKPKVAISRPSGPKPTVNISGPTLAANQSPVAEMVTLLRELVGEVRELTKVTRGVSGLGVQIYQQNAKLIRLGERQSQLAERLVKKGSGTGSESEGSGSRKDKGKGKAEVTGDKEETMRSDGDSEEEEEEEDEARLNEDVGGSVVGSGSDTEK
jgi:hypothetical protein